MKYQQQTETAAITAAIPDPVHLVMLLAVIHSNSSGGNRSEVTAALYSPDGSGLPSAACPPPL
ncbi:MAG: hypothetical protein ACOYL3_18855 [Desulfuromonadaceae bacterium]